MINKVFTPEEREARIIEGKTTTKRLIKKNEIISNEEICHKYEKKCIIDGAVFVTSVGVVCVGLLSKFSNETFSLIATPVALGIVGGATRFLKNANIALDYDSLLFDEREELYNIENELKDAKNKVQEEVNKKLQRVKKN